jgi:hypothetical protein
MKNTFTVELDGQMARIIVAALHQAALREKPGLTKDYHYLTADMIDEARHNFHTEAYSVLSQLYQIKREIAVSLEDKQ